MSKRDLYLDISGCDDYDGWFPQTVTIREMPDPQIGEFVVDDVAGFTSFHHNSLEHNSFDDYPIISFTIGEAPTDTRAELFNEGLAIGRLGAEFNSGNLDVDDPNFIILVAVLHRLLKLTGAKYVYCHQW